MQSRDNNKCRDFLKIMDGERETSREIATLCGKEMDKNPLHTTGNRLYMEFKSDENVEDTGFQFELSTVKNRTNIDKNYAQCKISFFSFFSVVFTLKSAFRKYSFSRYFDSYICQAQNRYVICISL